MPIRGTSAHRHAIIQKKVINRDEGGWGTPTHSGTHYVMCAWSYCENDGYEMYKVRVQTHADGFEERYMNYVFCSQGHKENWIDEWRHQMHLAEEAGKLPPGRALLYALS